MSGVDDLFSSEKVAPVPDRLARVSLLLLLAAPLNLFGALCFTSVPGALLSLLAWQLADDEHHRAEAGALPAERAKAARRLRAMAFSQLVFVGVLLMLQIALFSFGFYDALLQAVSSLLRG